MNKINKCTLEEAKKLLDDLGHLSVPFLQRKLKINHDTASKLISLLV